MRKYLPLIALLIALMTSANVFAEDFFTVEKIDDPDIIVYAPANIEPDTEYPVLYLIHGRWQQPSIWEDIGLSAALEELYSAEEIIPFYIVLPHDDNYLEDMYESGFYDEFINEVMPYVESHYSVSTDPKRTAVGGISRGAQWAQFFAFGEYGRFGVVGVHSPANPFYSFPKIYGIIRDNPDVPQIDIRIDIGNADNGMKIGQEFSKQLTDLFYPHEFVLGVGGHDVEYWGANICTYLKWYSAEFQK